MQKLNLIGAGVLAILGVIVAFGAFQMLVNCVYVPDGQSLRLRYKGPLIFGSGTQAKTDQFAQPGEVGVLEEMKGPGRHFYCPLWWERKLVDDIVVKPGEVAVVISKMGEKLPDRQFLVEGDVGGRNRARHQGTLRKVLGPGRYRVNNYAFECKPISLDKREVRGNTKYAGWVSIPTGFVGVVTDLGTGGVNDEVLPPGIYAVNPFEKQIDMVGIGFWETTIAVDHRIGPNGKELLDASGEPEAVPGSGIGFPSNDGFNIQLDFSAVWGVMPKDAPKVVDMFGSVTAAEQKVIIPQSESISRINGSKMGANELLVGETRQKFQTSVSEDFQDKLKETHLSLLYGLVRHIYIPKEIRQPLQEGYIANELKLTREEEKFTKQGEGELREAEKRVIQEAEKVKAETAKLVASALAEGEKQVGEIAAATKQQVAATDRKVAEFDAKKIEQLGKATAQADQLLKEATSQKFDLAVKAFGDAGAYTRWQFAEGLPENIQLQLFYAGEGTLWTDLKNVMPTLPVTNPTQPSAPSPALRPATTAPATTIPAASARPISGR